MKRLAVLIWFALATGALAQTAVVKSGDHPGFTRLVLELPKVAAWKMGRTSEGYELRVEDEKLRYDLTQVFTTIGRNRLASIWEDPVSGGLRIGIGCACHAQPFEFRPGIIVIDLKDGPPPKQSAVEAALDGTDSSPLTPKSTLRPRAKPQSKTLPEIAVTTSYAYDWLAKVAPPPQKDSAQSTMSGPAFKHEVTDITPIKDALLWQLSRGAAQGIVQMTQPNLVSRNSGATPAFGPRADIHLGDLPGFEVATTRQPANMLLQSGADCIQDDALDLGKWGTDQAVSVQLADSRANLVGEFDRPQKDRVILATKFFIYLGFGAEARQLLSQFSVEAPGRDLWNSMAKIVDGAPDPDGPFGGMQACDTAAALWAAMALPQFRLSEAPRTEAVLRAFSALPIHLRRSLGPDLVAKFLDIGDVSTARSLDQAVRRGGANTGAATTVMSATIDLAAGNSEKAVADLEPVLNDPGPATAETLIALVDAKLAAGAEIGPEIPVALAAIVQEQAGTRLDPALRRARILALAASGDFDQAFELVPNTPLAANDLWAILAKSGSDTAVLTHAVLPTDTILPALPVAERTQLATHVLALGLPDAALIWIGASNAATTREERLIAAKASLAKGRPDDAVAWIANLDDSDALDLRAQALLQQNKPAEAAQLWDEASNPDAALRAQSWARNWGSLAKSDVSQFKAAAELVAETPIKDAAQTSKPLALASALIADSERTRKILDNLLGAIPHINPTN